jgi:hypothetical protein
MDLKTIVERLQKIEALTAVEPYDDALREMITELRLDIEAYLLRTTGTL